MIEWRRYRTTAGIAYYRRNAIGLSIYVLQTPEQVQTTLIHEYAHLLAVHRHGAKAANHGQAWRQAMLDLGAEPIVKHRYEVERNPARQRVIYRCLACHKEFERKRRLPRNRKYVHAGCGGGLRFVRLEVIDSA